MRLLETGIGLAGGADPEARNAPPRLEFAFPSPEGPRGSAPESGEALAVLSLRAAGSMRYRPAADGGAEGPAPARLDFFASLGIAPGRVVATELHHTRRVRFVAASVGTDPGSRAESERDCAELPGEDEGDGGPDAAEGRDGLVIAVGGERNRGSFPGSGPVPAITVADCMPIWILDRATGSYGVLHSGWRGTGILGHAIRGLLARRGRLGPRLGDPGRPVSTGDDRGAASSIAVVLGPAIGPCCYEVPEARARLFEGEFGPAAVDWSGGRPRLDLRAANIALAASLGVGALLSVDACTSCESILGSYRREGAEAYTRMVALCLPA